MKHLIHNTNHINFMDSDDYININTLDILVKNIRENNDEIVVYNGIAFDNYDDEIKFHKKKYLISVKI